MGTTRTRRKVKSKVGSLWIPGINCLLYFIDSLKTNLSESYEEPHTHRNDPGECAALSLYNFTSSCQAGLVRQDSPHPHRQAGSALDRRADGESDGTGRGDLIQVAKHLHLQLALAQHIPLTSQVTRSSGQN